MTSLKEQGTAAFKAKEFDKAIDLYTQAITENPTDHTLFGNRSAARYSLKNFEEALDDAEKCIEVKNDWSKGYQRKAMAL